VGVISETPSLIPVADEPDASQEHRHAPSSYERPIKGLPRWAGILTPGIRWGAPPVTPRVKPRSLSPLGSWLLATRFMARVITPSLALSMPLTRDLGLTSIPDCKVQCRPGER
jgi:hypothetical protein